MRDNISESSKFACRRTRREDEARQAIREARSPGRSDPRTRSASTGDSWRFACLPGLGKTGPRWEDIPTSRVNRLPHQQQSGDPTRPWPTVGQARRLSYRQSPPTPSPAITETKGRLWKVIRPHLQLETQYLIGTAVALLADNQSGIVLQAVVRSQLPEPPNLLATTGHGRRTC
jgi:hypothetical protein